jgi:hypothetical protein
MRDTLGNISPSRAISLLRLQRYERECRHQAAAASDAFSRTEFSKLSDAFLQRIRELEDTTH